MTETDLAAAAKHFPARKQFGQNFLVNKQALKDITKILALSKGEQVLEIGPGLGFLTQELVATGAVVTAIEIDRYCVDTLQQLSLSDLKIIENDFLQMDLAQVIDSKFKIVGNIPYNITTPIIAKLLGEIGQPVSWLSNIEMIVLTVQLEVAQRLVAKPGQKDYSQITLLMNYFGKTEMVFKLPAKDFSPVPKIDSAVIKFIPHKRMSISCNNHTLLRRLIQTAFGRRRKMLKNNLLSLHLGQTAIDTIFSELNFDPQVRAENLSLSQYAKLANAVEIVKNKL